MSSVQDLNNNEFLLSILAAVIQQTQQQQQQQQQLQEQLQEQQQQVWSAALAAAQSQLAAAAAAAAVSGSPQFSNASSPPCQLGASGGGGGNASGGLHFTPQQQQQLQQQLQLHMQPLPPPDHHNQQHHQQFSNASSPCPPLGATTNGQHPPMGQCPSSSLLAKLNAVTSRPQAHLPAHMLDNRMIDLLEALYAINDNPEMGAIEMISKRINVPCDLVADWFDKKRMELNPFAGPRSPPCNKKREGGRVVTFSEYQRSLLEGIFNENNYLHPQEYEELSKLIQVPSRNIKIWFKNRRSKQRLSGGSQK